jgi:arylsulfatase A
MVPAHYRHDHDGYVTYAAMVTRMDRDVAMILNKLVELGIDNNTLVIFTSDNGHEFDRPVDGFLNSNAGMRGRKRDLYEGGIRVPFVARWPGKIPAGTVSNHASAFWDFLPTACQAAGIKPSKQTDGISYLPALLGNNRKQQAHEYLYWEFNERQGPIQAITKGDWKLLYFHVKNQYELYNLKEDPSEQNNLTDIYPDLFEKLKTSMHSARSEHPEFPLIPMQ